MPSTNHTKRMQPIYFSGRAAPLAKYLHNPSDRNVNAGEKHQTNPRLMGFLYQSIFVGLGSARRGCTSNFHGYR